MEDIKEQLKSKKIWIGYGNYEMFGKVQEILFRCGIKWNDGEKIIYHFDSPSLFIWDDLTITHGDFHTYHYRKDFEEMSLEEFFELTNQKQNSMDKSKSISVHSDNGFLKQAFLDTLFSEGYIFYQDIDLGKKILFFNCKDKYCKSSVGVGYDVKNYYLGSRSHWSEALSKVKELYNFYNEPVYKVGDKFKSKITGNKYILANTHTSLFDGVHYINFINIEYGNKWNNSPIKVENKHNISKDIIRKLDSKNYLEKIDE